jgi:hypothetical protein
MAKNSLRVRKCLYHLSRCIFVNYGGDIKAIDHSTTPERSFGTFTLMGNTEWDTLLCTSDFDNPNMGMKIFVTLRSCKVT